MSVMTTGRAESAYLEDLRNALGEFVGDRLGATVEVDGLRRMAGGTGHETWAFDVRDPAGLVSEALVLRRNIEMGMLDSDPRVEFELLVGLDRAGIAVPRPRWCVTENSPLGQPFMIVDRLSGTDIRKYLAAHPEVDRAVLGRRLVGLQARLHRLDWRTNLPSLGESSGEEELPRWADMITAATSDPGPLLALALDWLRAHPPVARRRCLVHGDFKTNNLIVSADGAVSVLDWELAHLGDPVEDLAWTMLWTTGFDLVGGLLPAEDYLAAYRAETGCAPEPAVLRYWRIFALVKLAAMMLTGSSGAASPTLRLMGRAVHHIDAELGPLLAAALAESGVR
jgi:aminoglycoside phosphotransferase (APT) family kinase protein